MCLDYGPTLFASLEYSPAQTLQFQGGIVLTGLVSLLISMLFVDRIPRNVMLASGMIAVSIPLACEAAVTARYLDTTNKSGLAAGVAMLYLYIFAYGVFLDGPGYFYVSRLKLSCMSDWSSKLISFKANEIFPTHL